VRPARTVLASAALILTLAACGDDSETAADPTPSAPVTSAATSAPADDTPALCAAVDPAQLDEWAGTPMREITGVSQDGVENCEVVSQDSGLLVTWQTTASPGSLDAAVDAADPSSGLQREPLELGDAEAALLTGAQGTKTSARVVAILGEDQLFVDASSIGDFAPGASPDTLRAVATGIAQAVAG
jgi:hypothetical protein